MHSLSTAHNRSHLIAHARELVIGGRLDVPTDIAPWLTRSWKQCSDIGMRPNDVVELEPLSHSQVIAVTEQSHQLISAARPAMHDLSVAVGDARYFVVLTDHKGVAVEVGGEAISHDKRAQTIARVGVDLSKNVAGTSAISGALAEMQPVWVHGGEHFFDVFSALSCAGAPIIGPHGLCVGMLNLTGIEIPERAGLKHMVAHYVQRIENTMTINCPHALLLHLTWPGQMPGGDADGLVALDHDGYVMGANSSAWKMIAQTPRGERIHANDLFAESSDTLFDLSSRFDNQTNIATWCGMQLFVTAFRAGRRPHFIPVASFSSGAKQPRLRDMEAVMIKQAVAEAKGNVAAAAKRLGVSRATLYRKLG